MFVGSNSPLNDEKIKSVISTENFPVALVHETENALPAFFWNYLDEPVIRIPLEPRMKKSERYEITSMSHILE